MLDPEKNKSRRQKHDQKRYGVSLVYLPDTETLASIRAWLNKLDVLCGGAFMWYPVLHLSLVRCKSILEQFEVKDTALLCCGSVKREKTRSIKADIGSDGVLRLPFSGITLEGITEVDRFYSGNGLRYDLITDPWMSLGFIDIERENAAKAVISLAAYLAEGQFPCFEMTIHELSAVYYHDILLKTHTLIKKIYLH